MCDVDKLATKLLELSKQLANSSKSFHLTLKTDDINFSCSSKDRDLPLQTAKRIKKKSPSQKNRDHQRRKTFLEQKSDKSTSDKSKKEESDDENASAASEASFECDQCDFEANCKVSLRKHIGMKHKLIPQLDGHTEDETTEQQPDPPDSREQSREQKNSKVQTCDICDDETKDLWDHTLLHWKEDNQSQLTFSVWFEEFGTLRMKKELFHHGYFDQK